MKFNRAVRQDLSQEKRDEYGKYIVNVLDQIEDLEEQKKATSARFKGQIEEKMASMREYRSAIRNDFVMVDVECDEVMDFPGDKVNIVRLDTMEAIDDRPITDLERQHKLDLDEQKESEQPTGDASEESTTEADGAAA